MILYLDESKKIGEGKIVFGGFITHHKHSYIQKIFEINKVKYGFSPELEIKGKNDTGKEFYKRMIQDIDFDFLKYSIIGVYAENYFKDSIEIIIPLFILFYREYKISFRNIPKRYSSMQIK